MLLASKWRKSNYSSVLSADVLEVKSGMKSVGTAMQICSTLLSVLEMSVGIIVKRSHEYYECEPDSVDRNQVRRLPLSGGTSARSFLGVRVFHPCPVDPRIAAMSHHHSLNKVP
ncbi:unnamed protein product [Strongylus vulgaris]|uniref:Uncharacterized protein n=1 Tax=Strongylus vulgaris TaxID=40348 RepID=A0A3P7IXI8_STRVU|nr:unnamed protein product [Strongylus vulgaris]